MTVLLPNPAILVVYDKFGFLIATDDTSSVDCFLLGVGVLDSAFTATDFDVPTARFIGNYVMRLGHDGSYLKA